jgi:hypothetical protein
MSRLARLLPAITSTGKGAFWPKAGYNKQVQAINIKKFFMATKIQKG